MYKLNVLFLNNNFYGSYASNQVFLLETVQAFKSLGVVVRVVSSIDDAVKAYKEFRPDFTMCFSKYFFFVNGNPLYEIYGVPHYQWISDNPLKMGLDMDSPFIHYIFIDKEFSLVADVVNKPLYLPLGYLEHCALLPNPEAINAVLVPCKIRNLDNLTTTIMELPQKKEILEFLEQYDYNSSFIKAFTSYCYMHEIKNVEKFFRITNEYVRVKKRLMVVNSIESHKVYIVGDDFGNNLKCKSGVTFIPPKPYKEIGNLMNRFRFIINVDPNYHACIHDRFIRAVSSGSCCISNYNEIMAGWNRNIYNIDQLGQLNSLLEYCDLNWECIVAEQREKVKHFSWQQSAKAIIRHFYTGEEVDSYAV